MVHELNDDRPGSLAVVIHWLAMVPYASWVPA